MHTSVFVYLFKSTKDVNERQHLNISRHDLQSSTREEFRLDSALYVGGVRSNKFSELPAALRATVGFKGCLASLDVNGVRPDVSTGRGERGRLVKGCIGECCLLVM